MGAARRRGGGFSGDRGGIMRRIRIFSIIFFILALALFAYSATNSMKHETTVGPKITMDTDSITVSVKATDEDLLKGVRAEDIKDGDISASLMVEAKGNFLENGRRRITIAAVDSDNNVTKISREVTYTDYQSPKWQLDAPLRFPLGVTDVLPELSVKDRLDGDLTGRIKISDKYSLKAERAGDYPMEFIVSNSAGDVVTLPVTVTIYDELEESKKPHITLSDYLVYVKKGRKIDPWDYVEKITLDGKTYERYEDGLLYEKHYLKQMLEEQEQEEESEDETEEESSTPETEITDPEKRVSIQAEDIEIRNDIDYSKEGASEVTYRIHSVESGEEGIIRLIVVVME